MPEEPQPTGAVNVFFSYAHEDKELRDDLATQLKMLERKQIISSWHDRKIGAGGEWAKEIDDRMKEADIILLLVSPDFIASDYCYDIELNMAMQRHEAGEARVVPVILRPCDWLDAPFGKLNALPEDGLPVTKWDDLDEAFLDVAKGIRKAAEEIIASRRSVVTIEAPPASTAKSPSLPLIPRPPIVGFVARRDEQGRDIVERLTEELAPSKNQLVALWGPGGAGKTTLAAEVVRATEDVFNKRVAWVSSLRHADLTLATLLNEIAAQLGRDDLRTLAPEPKAAEVAALVAAHPTLVVLDNFETIAAEEQTRCLDFLAQNAACPALITTRTRINRDDVYNLPLAAMESDEARDFLQRLIERTRKPSNFDKLDRDDLIQKCEANPLVLQWVVRQIDLAKRPQDLLNELAQGEGDAAERVFTRSFDLPQVGDDGRDALLALSLFTPHASRESLAEVAGFGADLPRLAKAVEGLSALWLVETTEGNERLFLRGLTRELSKSRLSKDAHADEFRRRYVAHFLRHAEAHAQPTPEDLDALEAEKSNVLGAIDLAYAMEDWESVMQIRSKLDMFLWLRGYLDDAARSGRQAAKAAQEMKNDWNVASFKANVAVIYKIRGEYERATEEHREAIEIFKKLGSAKNVAVGLHYLGWIAQDQGDFQEAERLHNESLSIRQKIKDDYGIAASLHHLGMVKLSLGALPEAEQLCARALELFKRFGDYNGLANALTMLAILADLQGNSTQARQLFNESLELKRQLGDQEGTANALNNMGLFAERENDKTEAARLFRESLHIYERLGLPETEKVRANLARVEGSSD